MMIMTKKEDIETKIGPEGLMYRYKGTDSWHYVADEADLYTFEEVEEKES